MCPSSVGRRRGRRRATLTDIVRRRIALLIASFAIPGILVMVSDAGPAPGAPRIIAILVLLSTVPVAAFVQAARRSFRWWRRQKTQHVVAFAFTVYADVGTSIFLLLCRNHALALAGCSLFAVISCYVAFFTGRATVFAHLALTTGVIAWLTIRVSEESGDDVLAVVAAALCIWLGVNATMSIVSATSNSLHHHLQVQITRAQTDPLTGLLNLRGLEVMAARTVRRDQEVGFLLIDLDHFKWVNDRYGHIAGDDVLSLAAARLKTFIGDRGVIARRGGEEFLVLVDAGADDPVRLAENVRLALFDTRDAIPVTVSIGVSVAHTGDSTHSLVNTGMHLADIAMYRAKSAGRNTVVVYDDGGSQESNRRGGTGAVGR